MALRSFDFDDEAHDLAWFLDRLDLETAEPVRVTERAREYLFRCPSHNDTHPSGVLFDNFDGTIVVTCRSQSGGCTMGTIIQALQERESESTNARELTKLKRFLREKREPGHTQSQKENDATAQTQAIGPLAWWAEHCGVSEAFVRSHLPLREQGHYLVFVHDEFRVDKFRKAGTKDITWQPVGAKPVPELWPVPPTSLPEDIYILEGESDTTVARFLGWPAFGTTKGAGKALSAQTWKALYAAGARRVGLILDADGAGLAGARKNRDVGVKYGLEVREIDVSDYVDGRLLENDLRDAYRRNGDRLNDLISPEHADAGLPTRTIEEICATDDAPIAWQVENIVPDYGTILLAGDPGAGKSTLLFSLFDAVRPGNDDPVFLGKSGVPFHVLYASEDSEDIIRDRSAAYGSFPHIHMLFLDDTLHLRLDWPSTIQKLIQTALAQNASLVIIDTLLKWATIEDMNNATEVTTALTELRAFRKHNIAVMCLVHTRKAGGEHGQQVAGSAAIIGEADIAFVVERVGENQRRLKTLRTKKGPAQPDYHFREINRVLEYMDGGKVKKAIQHKRGLEQLEKAEPVLDAISAAGQSGMTAHHLGEVTGLSKDTIQRRLLTLIRNSRIVKREDTHWKGRFVYFLSSPDETIVQFVKGRDIDATYLDQPA